MKLDEDTIQDLDEEDIETKIMDSDQHSFNLETKVRQNDKFITVQTSTINTNATSFTNSRSEVLPSDSSYPSSKDYQHTTHFRSDFRSYSSIGRLQITPKLQEKQKTRNHTSLCKDQEQREEKQRNADVNISTIQETQHNTKEMGTVLHSQAQTNVILKTVVAQVISDCKCTDANILFDEGAERSFITEKHRAEFVHYRTGDRKLVRILYMKRIVLVTMETDILQSYLGRRNTFC
ncbi:unnamed protein product [Mytilus coruscus]|uniref:Uncharacterized protein n=1 Tax=Mytilus coruscus TaxID=42192 RepID=A0A6J8CXJ0_MYTCO|nr:unnamed protein product [Mytilus coruscus]